MKQTAQRKPSGWGKPLDRERPGEIYTLMGDLGVGKTVFTQGVAKGLGITEPISSPTFTIIQEYEDGRLPFYHFDVYPHRGCGGDGRDWI